MLAVGAAPLCPAVVPPPTFSSFSYSSRSAFPTFKSSSSTASVAINAGVSPGRFPVCALAGRRRRGPVAGVSDVEYNDDDDYYEEERDEDVDWLENKPAGFGEGKTYDTSLEDELLEEMEISRKALMASFNRKKKEAGSVKKQEPHRKETDVIQSGIRVRVWNLPRKKNIYRDLNLAFKGFPGILNINPAVIANQKTRDPVCKGFAFIDLQSDEAANRFVHTYSKQNLLFGKVKKQIMCDLVNPRGSGNYCDEQPNDNTQTTQQQSYDMEDETLGSHVSLLSWDSADSTDEGSITREPDVMTEGESDCIIEGEYTYSSSSDLEELEMETGELEIPIADNYENNVSVDEDEIYPDSAPSPFQKQHKRKMSRKSKGKTKSKNTSKLSVPSSVTRLKSKERTVLTGVFSKYGAKVSTELANQR